MRGWKNVKSLFFKPLLCFVLAGLCLSACRAGLSIQKRKYTRGYYITYSGRKQTISSDAHTSTPTKKQEPVKVQTPVAKQNLPEAVDLQPEASPVTSENPARQHLLRPAPKLFLKKTAVLRPVKQTGKRSTPSRLALRLPEANHGVSALGTVLLIAGIIFGVLLLAEIIFLIMIFAGNTSAVLVGAATVFGFIDLILLGLAMITLGAN